MRLRLKIPSLGIKKFLPRTLFGRSLLILVVPVLLIQVITTYTFFERHWSRMTSRLAYAVAGEIAVAVKMIEDGTSPRQLENMMAYDAQHLNLLMGYEEGANISDFEKGFTVYPWESMVSKTLTQELANQLHRPFSVHVDFGEKWTQVAVQLEGGVLSVKLPQRRLFSSSGYVFLLWMFASSIVLLSIAVLFMRNQIRPIRKLAAAASRFGKGQNVLLKPEGAREVRQATQAFLEMHERIRRQIEQRTAMLAGVSHDLRTPLTRMKLQLAMMGSDPDILAMKKDIEDMERMIEGYIDFVRGEGDERAEMTDLRPVLEKCMDSAAAQGMKVSLECAEDLCAIVKPMAFERCISNLVSNAAKHGKSLWLSARLNGGALAIDVEDDGPGIPEEQHEDVFRPFYRVDSSRNAATGGVGLGLPIVMDIVHSHGGSINLGRSAHGGLKVEIRIPV